MGLTQSLEGSIEQKVKKGRVFTPCLPAELEYLCLPLDPQVELELTNTIGSPGSQAFRIQILGLLILHNYKSQLILYVMFSFYAES